MNNIDVCKQNILNYEAEISKIHTLLNTENLHMSDRGYYFNRINILKSLIKEEERMISKLKALLLTDKNVDSDVIKPGDYITLFAKYPGEEAFVDDYVITLGEVPDDDVIAVTIDSPIGKALLGRKVGDSFKVTIENDMVKEPLVVEILVLSKKNVLKR